jgi:hypothetical protein
MKLELDKFLLNDINKNIKTVQYNNKTLKFWSPPILAPFGIDKQYDKYLIKLELDKNNEEHNHLKRIIETVETMLLEKTNVENREQLKSVIYHRPNKLDIIECKIKMFKGNVATQVEFQNQEENYLKSVLEIPKQSKVKVLFEVNGLWDYRDPDNPTERNKIGLILYANKIIV